MSNDVTRIVIADDHAIIRRGLSLIISQAEDLDAEGAASVEELFAQLRSLRPDLLVLSVSFCRFGVDVLRRVKTEFRNLPVLMFNSQSDDLAAMRTLSAGASGYIQTEGTPEELLAAIRRLRSGGQYVSHTIAEKIAAELARGGKGESVHE